MVRPAARRCLSVYDKAEANPLAKRMAEKTIRSPIDDRVVGRVPAMSRAQVDRAMKAARKAQPVWAARSVAERRRILKAAARELRKDASPLADILTREVGKVSKESRDEILRTADLIDATAAETKPFEAETNRSQDFPKGKPGRVQTVRRRPVDMIAMTGSTTVGKRIARKAGMLPLLLELGGNDPAIVLADADLGRAAKTIVSGAFRYNGQRCTAIKRVYVVRSVADRLVEAIVAERDATFPTAGDPRKVSVGPVISDQQARYLKSVLQDAVRNGGDVVAGGSIEGRYVEPTIIDRVPHRARIVCEEQFGPILPIIRVKDAAEAVRLANDTEYGLQAAVFTKSLKQAETIAEALDVGGVHLNGPDQRGPDNFLFTGWKDSGLGDQGIRYALEAMSRRKGAVRNRTR